MPTYLAFEVVASFDNWGLFRFCCELMYPATQDTKNVIALLAARLLNPAFCTNATTETLRPVTAQVDFRWTTRG